MVSCNVPKRGWMGGVGGCPNVGGICIGCTMPGFPDSFMPFMNEPTGGNLSLSSALVKEYGDFVHRMRRITGMALNLEPEWRHNGPASLAVTSHIGTGRAPQPTGPDNR